MNLSPDQKKWNLILNEPFRVCFPMGMAVAFMSVMLWPMYYLNWLTFYPLDAHNRTMIVGYIGTIVIGFLGTALPRLLGVKGMRSPELLWIILVWGIAMISYLSNHIAFGDLIGLILLTTLYAGVIIRFPSRKDTPPPGFILVATSLLSIWVALFIQVLQSTFGFSIPVGFVLATRELLYTGFPCFLLMGVAPYFFPKILGTQNRHEFEESRTLPKGWTPIAFRAALASIAGVIGLGLRSNGIGIGGWIFASAILIYGLLEIPMIAKKESRGSMSTGLLIGLSFFYLGVLMMAVFPIWKVGFFHLTIIGGLSLCIMIVSIRVTYGHSGNRDKTEGKKLWVRTLIIVLVVTALTRLTADFFPVIRVSHLIYAAIFWTISQLIWLRIVKTHLFEEEEE